MTTTTVTDDAVVVPARHVDAIRHAALRDAGMAAEVLYRKIDTWTGPGDADDAIACVKQRLDDHWALFLALTVVADEAGDIVLPAEFEWAVREAAEYRIEWLRDEIMDRVADEERIIANAREMESLLPLRAPEPV